MSHAAAVSARGPKSTRRGTVRPVGARRGPTAVRGRLLCGRLPALIGGCKLGSGEARVADSRAWEYHRSRSPRPKVAAGLFFRWESAWGPRAASGAPDAGKTPAFPRLARAISAPSYCLRSYVERL